MQKEQPVQSYLKSTITKLHDLLIHNFTHPHQERQLTSFQSQLLKSHPQHSNKYKQIAGVISIESYIQYIIRLIAKCQPLLQITALLFNSLAEMKQTVQGLNIPDLNQQLFALTSNVSKSAQILHHLFPHSPLVAVNQQFITSQGSDPTQAIYARLYDQNQQLKSKLQQNDRQLLSIQLRLTKLLRQSHDEQTVENSLKVLQLREMVNMKEMQIQRMNQEFGIQINKYNVVYEAMKRQIEELRSYQHVNQYELIQDLQTEIVRLRQEKQRDQQIIKELSQTIQFANTSRYQSKITYSRMQY